MEITRLSCAREEVMTNCPCDHPLTNELFYVLFYVPLKNFSLLWRRHHYQWRTLTFTPMFGTHGLWAGRDLHRATPVVTLNLNFPGLIWRTLPHLIASYDSQGDFGLTLYSNQDTHGSPFSRLLWHARDPCKWPILTQMLTGLDQLTRLYYSEGIITIFNTHPIYPTRIWSLSSSLVLLVCTAAWAIFKLSGWLPRLALTCLHI
jgi:hypothetical protein